MNYPILRVNPQRERILRFKNPWILAASVQSKQKCENGDVVDILTVSGEWLGRGYYNSKSQIAVRVLSWDQQESIDDLFFSKKISTAVALRKDLGLMGFLDGDSAAAPSAFRLISSEADQLPGLIADVYGNYLVLQFLTLGMERHREGILSAFESYSFAGILERSDSETRIKEGMDKVVAVLRGNIPETPITISENGIPFTVELFGGHKTGFYLDQRISRQRMFELIRNMGPTESGSHKIPPKIQILNAFSYTGGFGVYAAKANAQVHVTNVDSSKPALAMAQRNFEINQLLHQADFIPGKCSPLFKQFAVEGRVFDVIVLDPPKFAPNKSVLRKATHAYKELHRLAFALLRDGGYLFTFSCSGAMKPDLFRQLVIDVGLKEGKHLQVLEQFGHAFDHPILGSFPEGEYLKGFLLRVLRV